MRASPYKSSRGYREPKAAGLNIKYDRMMKAIEIGSPPQYRRRHDRQSKKVPMTPSVSEDCGSCERENTGSPPSWLTQTLLALEPGHASHQLLLTRDDNEASTQPDETDPELQSTRDDCTIFAYLPQISHQSTRLLGSEGPLVNQVAPGMDDYLCSYTRMSQPPRPCSPGNDRGNVGTPLASAQRRYAQLANEAILVETLPYSTPGPTFFNMNRD
ncbi:hypothetical protein M378DRAFT_161020 [Amanita muscaria Koide BX008]|uniref:Uncharacterized protein n=1 Tax=Amanita muscaria (strain Koide BX008) TaxID=946122 RepID=A0A0C2TGY7_AMAMK|nr:hypothetical protein M378DRAFT_161020 [Amanita muscaria Koide BX008]